jgi:hypothetical protein
MRRFSLPVALVALMMFTMIPSARAQEREERGERGEGRAATTQPGARGARGAQPVNLEREMENMGRAFRRLQSTVKDKSQNAASLDAIQAFEAAAVASKSAVPPMVARLPEDQRQPQLMKYRQMMVNLLIEAVDLEDMILAGDNAKAAEHLTAMDDLQKRGHADFRPAGGD